jgi:hypothetical protein
MRLKIQAGTSETVRGTYTEDDGTTPIPLPGRGLSAVLVQRQKVVTLHAEILDGGANAELLFEFPASLDDLLSMNFPAELRLSSPSLSDPTDILPLGVLPVEFT